MTTIKYEVLQEHNRFGLYRPYSVWTATTNGTSEVWYYTRIRRYRLLKAAEAHAKGLGDGTWTKKGQILSSWTSLNTQKQENSSDRDPDARPES